MILKEPVHGVRPEALETEVGVCLDESVLLASKTHHSGAGADTPSKEQLHSYKTSPHGTRRSRGISVTRKDN